VLVAAAEQRAVVGDYDIMADVEQANKGISVDEHVVADGSPGEREQGTEAHTEVVPATR